MTRAAVLCVALILWTALVPVAQESTASTAADLVSTWTLTSVERGVSARGEAEEEVEEEE